MALPNYRIECWSVRVPHAVTSGTFYVFFREDGTRSRGAYGLYDEARKGIVYDAFDRGLIDESFRSLALTCETYDLAHLRAIKEGRHVDYRWKNRLEELAVRIKAIEDFWAARRAEVNA